MSVLGKFIKHALLLFITALTFISCQQKIHGLDNRLVPLAELKLNIHQAGLNNLPRKLDLGYA